MESKFLIVRQDDTSAYEDIAQTMSPKITEFITKVIPATPAKLSKKLDVTKI